MGSSISAGTPMIAESISAYHNISKTSRRTEEKKEDIAVTKKEDKKHMPVVEQLGIQN